MRNLLLSMLAIVAAIFTQCNTTKMKETQEILVGTYTHKGSKGIYRVMFDSEKGVLRPAELLAEAASPSYLAINKARTLVYAVNESDGGSVSAFSRDTTTGALNLITNVPSEGRAPCHVAISPNEELVAVANYMGGNAVVFRAGTDGALSNPRVFQHEGTGPNEKRQEGPHAHFVQFSADGRFLYVVDLGIDQVKRYDLNAPDSLAAAVALQLEPGDGPRHFIMHPSKPMVFLVNELSNTVVSAAVDESSGLFTTIDRQTTLPADFAEHSQCADIHISSDGRFLYASNRGHHSIAIYEVAENGALRFLGAESVRGEWPRNFTLSPDERHLIVANEHSHNIVVFDRNTETGLLTYTGNELEVFSPTCVKF